MNEITEEIVIELAVRTYNENKHLGSIGLSVMDATMYALDKCVANNKLTDIELHKLVGKVYGKC